MGAAPNEPGKAANTPNSYPGWVFPPGYGPNHRGTNGPERPSYTRTAPLYHHSSTNVYSYYARAGYIRLTRAELERQKKEQEAAATKKKKEEIEAKAKADAEEKKRREEEAKKKAQAEEKAKINAAGWNTMYFFGGEETRQMFLRAGFEGNSCEVGEWKWVGEPGKGGFRICEVRKKQAKVPEIAKEITPALALHLMMGPPEVSSGLIDGRWCGAVGHHPGGALSGWTDFNPEQQRYAVSFGWRNSEGRQLASNGAQMQNAISLLQQPVLPPGFYYPVVDGKAPLEIPQVIPVCPACSHGEQYAHAPFCEKGSGGQMYYVL